MEEAWERPPRLELSRSELQSLIEPAFPGAVLAAHSVFTSGLANTNVRFRLRGGAAEYVLRLHTREPEAAARERELMGYLAGRGNGSIPVAPLLYADPEPLRGRHPYSIWGFVEGTLLQELFKSLPRSSLVEIALVCGRVAAAFSEHPFPSCGAFGSKLAIVEEYGPPSQFVPQFVYRALFDGRAGQRLGAELRDALWTAVERSSPLLREIDGRYSLVHADFKRSNILLRRLENAWRVVAVLDWEFAFAGPPLVDVGLFLRGGEALPEGFREAFATGYRDAGGELPREWLRLSRLVDLLSQMTFLDDPRERPRVVAETTRVVAETVRLLAPL